LFSYCGTALIGECTALELAEKIKLCFWHAVPENITKMNNLSKLPLYYVLEDQIQVQFQALGLMEPGTKKRAVSDTNMYWKLTPFGKRYLIQVRALRRNSDSSAESKEI